MPDILWQDVLDVAADVAGLTSLTAQAKILSYVNQKVDPAQFGGTQNGVDDPTYVLARCYLAAHMALLTLRGGSVAGPLTSESEGGVSAAYANMNYLRRPLLTTTVYGQQFARLLDVSPAVAGVVI